MEIVYLHELGHHILDPKLKLIEPYLNEGFANFFAVTITLIGIDEVG